MPLESYDLPSADPPLPVARTAANLQDLRSGLEGVLPPRDLDRTLRVASWNVKQLGGRPRLPESYWYIAEVLSHFDVAFLRDLAGDLRGLERVRALLGDSWAFLVSDLLGGGDTEERVGILYDTRTVQFTGITGEFVLPDTEVVGRRRVPVRALARTPLMATFRAGGFGFALAGLQLRDPAPETPDPEAARRAAGEAVALHMAERTVDPSAPTRNLVLLGDFDFHEADSAIARELLGNGFGIPVGRETLLAAREGRIGRFYDQIAYRFGDRPRTAPLGQGVLPLFDWVFRDDQYSRYRPELRKDDGQAPRDPASFYRQYFRRDQLSDHLPIWAAFDIDLEADRLDRLAVTSRS
jgi:hypothetical protein